MNRIKSDPTKAILTITVGFLIVYLISHWKWALSVSLIIGLIGVFSNYLSIKIEYLWMKLASLLSLIIPKILLSIVFYVFLFPIALLSKLFNNKDPLILKNKTDSTFINVNKEFEKDSFEKLW